jgi:hemoglobin
MRRAVADVAPQPADMAKAMADVLADMAIGMGRS